MISTSSSPPAASAPAPLPPNFSGVVPSLAQVADFGPPRSEIGVGCLMPWQGRLYVLNYVSHRRQTGTGTGLNIIDADFRMTRSPAAVDGTYANRFVHHESSQLIIGPHLVDTKHNVRTVAALTETRLCGTARHLSNPRNLVYMLGMEGELFELNVRTLKTRRLFDLTRELDTPGEGSCHFKDCYSYAGRLVVVNNDYHAPDFLGARREGTLAEYDGAKWTVLERKPFVAVNGLGHLGGTIFASGWDRASAILKVFTKADGIWRTYRLPKASHTFDHKWQTEWPRIRSIEHERFLMDHHGMFYELSPWAFGNRIWGIRPISTHLWVHGDFCSWKGMLVIGADNTSHEYGGNLQCAEPQSGLWFGHTEDLWKRGKPGGWGGPWWDDAIEPDAPSDPYLMTGFDKKVLHLSHDAGATVAFTVEVDFLGCGEWKTYAKIEVPANGYVPHVFPDGFSAHWLRVTASAACKATAQLHYT
ncbi:MAG: hypothetical protein LBM04_04865 [Opitutaceae bacterium]|jgi:hypothetical protein|nr:hypothetical protein [Opitutaceae bacterium]